MSKEEALTSICEFKGCSEISSRTFPTATRLCEQHFHECLRVVVDLQAETREAMGLRLAEFGRKWRREKNLSVNMTMEDMTRDQLVEFLHSVRIESESVLNKEFLRWLQKKLKRKD